MIFRKVIDFNFVGACRYTGYRHRSIRLVLDCGHEQPSRKASMKIPRKARCRECERLSTGAAKREADSSETD